VLFFFRGIIIKISIVNQFNVKGWNRKKKINLKNLPKQKKKKNNKKMGIRSERKKMKDSEIEKKNSNSNTTY
jgi:hypothetical protein